MPHIGTAAAWKSLFDCYARAQGSDVAEDLAQCLQDYAVLEVAYRQLLTTLHALTADALVVHGMPSRMPEAPEAPRMDDMPAVVSPDAWRDFDTAMTAVCAHPPHGPLQQTIGPLRLDGLDFLAINRHSRQTFGWRVREIRRSSAWERLWHDATVFAGRGEDTVAAELFAHMDTIPSWMVVIEPETAKEGRR
jgi:hypothetical protein